MPRPIQAFVHIDALAHNLARARAAAPDAKVWAVVKADAYGHGIERAYEGLRGADGFALLDFSEAERVRKLGWRGPILMLEGCFEPRDLEACARLHLWHMVHHEAQIDWLAAAKLAQPQRVFLKLNSGMNRLGFGAATFRTAWLRLNGLPQVDEITLATHFADADGARGIDQQVAVFEAATRDLPGERSLSNSRGNLAPPATARAHRAKTGCAPASRCTAAPPIFPSTTSRTGISVPTMTLRTRLIGVQQLSAGDAVGYGSSFVADAPLRIGVAACGYADGYPRLAPTGTPVLVDGVRTRTVGRVSMDMITVDLGPVPHAGFGSEVTLWGNGPQRDGMRSVLPIDEVAQPAKTVGYELMCALAPRVPVSVA